MPRHIVLLRGINVGPHNRIAMPALREALGQAGYEDVRTYVQSGNIVLDSTQSSDALAGQIHTLIAERFGLDIPVLVRTGPELAQVVKANPLGDVADDPKRYQVSFLSADPPAGLLQQLRGLAGDTERVELLGREVYAWHPNGVAGSKLWNKLAGRGGLGSGLTAPSRNWTTITTVMEMANAG